MSPDQLRFALDSRRFFRLAHLLSRLPLPSPARVRLARLLGRLFSPQRRERSKLLLAFRLGLGLDLAEARRLFGHWTASDGLFATAIFDYASMGPEWVRRHVAVDQPEVLTRLLREGGLVLAFHTFHQNTMGLTLGQCGVPLFAIAATEKKSPSAPYTGRYMRIINGDSEAKFSGGRYLFTDDMRNLVAGVREAFAAGHTVVALCDNPVPDSAIPSVEIMGRSIGIGTGVMKLAQQARVPAYFVLFYPDLAGGYRLVLEHAGLIDDLETTARAYFHFLERQLCLAPWAWQGWSWYADLPPVRERSRDDERVKSLMQEGIALADHPVLRALDGLRWAARACRPGR